MIVLFKFDDSTLRLLALWGWFWCCHWLTVHVNNKLVVWSIL